MKIPKSKVAASALPLLSWFVIFYLPALGVLAATSIGVLYLAGGPTPHLNGWQRLGADDLAMNAMTVSVSLAITAAVITMVASLPASLSLRFYLSPTATLTVIPLLLLPLLSSHVLRAYTLQIWLGRNGIFQWLLTDLFGWELQISLLNTRGATIFGWVVSYMPIVVIVQWIGLRRVKSSEIAAAQNLGASPIRTWFYLILPRSGVGIGAGFLVVFVLTFSDAIFPSVLGGGNAYTAAMLLIDMIKINDLSQASALAIVIAAVCLTSFALIGMLATHAAGD